MCMDDIPGLVNSTPAAAGAYVTPDAAAISLCRLFHPNACSHGQPTFEAVCGKLDLLYQRRVPSAHPADWLQDEYTIRRVSSVYFDYKTWYLMRHLNGNTCRSKAYVWFLHWSSIVCNDLMITWFAVRFSHSWSSYSECTSTPPSLNSATECNGST